MKKIFSILLSFILLASHLNLALGTHFCGGEAVETQITMGEAHFGCGMSDKDLSCKNSGETNNHDVSIDKVPCCENEYQHLQVENEFVKDAAQLSFNVDFAVAFIYTTFNVDLFPKIVPQSFTAHSPPPLEKDIQVLFQTFLI